MSKSAAIKPKFKIGESVINNYLMAYLAVADGM